MAVFTTCSGDSHAFNRSISFVNYLHTSIKVWRWDFRCDCGKEKMGQDDLIDFLMQFKLTDSELGKAIKEYKQKAREG